MVQKSATKNRQYSLKDESLRNHHNFARAFAFGLAIVPLLAMEFPRMLGLYPSIFGIVMSAWWVFGLKEKLPLSHHYLIYAGIISTLIIASSLWSIEPAQAFRKSIFISATLLSSVLFVSLAKTIDRETLRPYLISLPIMMIIAALLCSFEIYFGMPLYKFSHQMEHRLNSSVMNRGIIVYCLSFFPVLSLISLIKTGENLKHILNALMIGSMVLMLALTQSQSAQMGIAIGFIVFLAFPYKKDWAYPILAGVIAAALLLTPLLVKLLFFYGIGGFAEEAWLRDGYAAHRLEIWEFVIRYAMHNPLYGYGLEATRFVPNFEHGYIIHKQPTVLHPHNFSVQIWMEFGAIGATLACLLVTGVIYMIRSMPVTNARPALALFLTILSISATGYGIWQGWWLGAIIFSIALLSLLRSEDNSDEKCIFIH